MFLLRDFARLDGSHQQQQQGQGERLAANALGPSLRDTRQVDLPPTVSVRVKTSCLMFRISLSGMHDGH